MCFTWDYLGKFIFSECGPGRYKGRVPAANDQCMHILGTNEKDACVLCSGNKIKSVSGDDPALCQDMCDGTTNVPNAARTACGE